MLRLGGVDLKYIYELPILHAHTHTHTHISNVATMYVRAELGLPTLRPGGNAVSLGTGKSSVKQILIGYFPSYSAIDMLKCLLDMQLTVVCTFNPTLPDFLDDYF